MKTFADSKSMEQHLSYHQRVALLIKMGEIDVPEPEVLLPLGAIDEEVRERLVSFPMPPIILWHS